MKLPHGDGWGVFQKVQQATPEARVIAIMGSRSESALFVQKVVADSANAVCYKPFDVPNFLSTISRLTRM